MLDHSQIVKLEQRLLALQSTKLMSCSNCQHLTAKLDIMREKFVSLLTERRDKLQELNNTK